MVESGLPPEVAETLLDDSAGEATWARVLAAFKVFRGAMIGHFLENPTSWFAGDFEVSALGALRADSWWRGRNPTSLTMADLVINEPALVIADFDPAKMRGRPILVAATAAGPWYIIEGAHRVGTIHRDSRVLGAPTLPVYVGICPSLSAWTRL